MTRLPLAGQSPPTWLELALDYRCNLRCVGCHACHDDGARADSASALRSLAAGRREGRTRLWLGGGEPTLRDDLLPLVRAAKAFGYEEVLLQTNGLRLAYPDYRKALVAAGVTTVSFNVKSHRSAVHDRLSGAPAHELLLQAIAGFRADRPEIRLQADVLLTRTGLDDLPLLVPYYAERGISRFVLWLLSLADSAEADVQRELPSFTELAPVLVHAARAASDAHVLLESLHTPPCTLPESLRSLYAPAAALGLSVVGPDGRSFALETSPFEGGAYVEACASCSVRGRCGGPRADYVKLHGKREFAPLPAALQSPP